MRWVAHVLSLTALMLAQGVSVSGAQVAVREAGARAVLTRPQLDYFLSVYRPLAGGGEDGEEAVGGRLMWPLEGAPGGWRERAAVGGYLIHSPSEASWAESWRYGVQADVRLLRSPVARRLEPIASLGVGALTLQESRWEPVQPPRLPAARPNLHSQTQLSVTPGVGLRLRLLPGIGLRGDARQAIDFGEGTRRNVEISGGLSVGV